MIRTKILPCYLHRNQADELNHASGQIYTGVLVAHWRVVRKHDLWLSEKATTRWSDYRTSAPLHSHSIDAAQQGFAKACKTARALKKLDSTTRYPYHPKRYRTTVWKNTAIRRQKDKLLLSNGAGRPGIEIVIPESLCGVLRFLEVRLVYDKTACRYNWHIVVENGKQLKVASDSNIVSVDLGEIHPAVIGDGDSATIITCRERRHQQQGHAKRHSKLAQALARKKKDSRRYRKLLRTKTRMKGKHARIMRDIAHKLSHAVVDEAVKRRASTIVVGDVRDIADGVNLGKQNNQKISGWNHGKLLSYVKYKATAEGIAVVLQNERYSSQTCPQCGNRHKPRGRNYNCPSCGFSGHRDVIGQTNILSLYLYGKPGKLAVPWVIKHREPYSIRSTRRRRDTGQVSSRPVARANTREATGL